MDFTNYYNSINKIVFNRALVYAMHKTREKRQETDIIRLPSRDSIPREVLGEKR